VHEFSRKVKRREAVDQSAEKTHFSQIDADNANQRDKLVPASKALAESVNRLDHPEVL
jgi:hypothetical protein